MPTCKAVLQVSETSNSVALRCDLEEHSADVNHEDWFQLTAWNPLTAGHLARIASLNDSRVERAK